MYLNIGVTHRAETVIKRGQSEYICDCFSNNSEVMALEFRTITLAPKSWMYSMSPGKAQGMNDHFSLHSPYFAFYPVRVSQINWAFTERTLPKNGSGVGPAWGERGHPFLSLQFRRILRSVSTLTIVSTMNTMNLITQVVDSISLLWERNSWTGIRSYQRCWLYRSSLACQQLPGVELHTESTRWS